jgi:UDP-GlcNAc:undecaprenyl-phosphate GlcNAc-1-phosphate transferase
MSFPFLLLILGFSFLLSLGLSFGVLYFFPKLGLMDRPERYGHQRPPIPYPGGLALSLAVLVSVCVFLDFNPQVLAVIFGTLLLIGICFWDDRRSLPVWVRLLAQICAGLFLVIGGVGIHSLSNPFGDPIILDAWHLSAFFTVVWVGVMINAFNWIDGVPGMTSGVAVVSSGILLLLSLSDFHTTDQSLAIGLSAMVFGASLAFHFFDFPPPKMLMGDTGSMVLGFLMAVIALISGGKVATTVLVLSFPLLDFIWVIVRRIFRGQSPFKGDLWHFHHRFLKAGFSPRQVVVIFLAGSGLFGALALFAQSDGKLILLVAVVVLMAFLAAFLYSKQRTNPTL